MKNLRTILAMAGMTGGMLAGSLLLATPADAQPYYRDDPPRAIDHQRFDDRRAEERRIEERRARERYIEHREFVQAHWEYRDGHRFWRDGYYR